MEVAITSMLQTSVDWVTKVFEAPFARAVVFGVQIGGTVISLYQFLLLGFDTLLVFVANF